MPLPNVSCIVRSTWLLALAGRLSVASFIGGFSASSYLIDCELADSTEVLNRSGHAYQAEQALWFRQWADGYAQLSKRIAAIPQRKKVAYNGRR